MTRGRRRSLVVAWAAVGLISLAGFTLAPSRSGAIGDTTAPHLVSLTLSRSSVDTASGPVDIAVDVHITDDTGLSIGGPVPLTHVDLTGPNGQQHATGYVSRAQLVSGNATDGTYRTTITMRSHSEPGAWKSTVTLVDSIGNTATVASSTVTQTGAGDTTPPQLMSLSVTPATIDTSGAPATLTVAARVTDDLAGVSDGVGVASSQVVFRGPSGAHHARATLDTRSRVGANPLDASYVVAMTVPQWAEQGTWTVESVDLVDEAGNTTSVGVPNVTFNQTGIGDVTPPTLRALSFGATSVDVRLTNGSLTLQSRVTDDRSGVADGFGSLVYRSPSGRQELTASVTAGQRQTGSGIDGTYRTTLAIPNTSENGAWTLRVATFVDAATNAARLTAADMTALGFPASFTVVSNVDPGTVVTLPDVTSVPSSSSTLSTFDVSTTSTLAPSSTTTPATVPGSTSSTVTTSTTDTTSPDTATTVPTGDSSSTTTTTPSSTTTDATTTDTTVPVIDDSSSTTTSTTSTTTSATTSTTVIVSPLTTTTTVPVTSTGGKPRPASGYWFATARGQVAGLGAAKSTSVASAGFDGFSGITIGIAPTKTGNGYWLATTTGDVRGVGDARVFGSLRGRALKRPIVGIAATPTGKGYWLVASDGGIFTFGDAHFFGSAGAMRLNQPIVGMAATPTAKGYWLVASDGGIFTFGDAHFFGSTGAMRLNQPIVGMAATPTAQGYWLVASDGGIFTFGTAHFFGSAGNLHLVKPIVGMAATPTTKGYWMVGSDGGMFTFGDAKFFGAFRSSGRPIVGMAVRA